MLEKEFQYYLDNQEELVKKFNGQFLIIVGEEVVNHANSFESALELASSQFELGTFLIQECLPGEESHTQLFHSRVIFS